MDKEKFIQRLTDKVKLNSYSLPMYFSINTPNSKPGLNILLLHSIYGSCLVNMVTANTKIDDTFITTTKETIKNYLRKEDPEDDIYLKSNLRELRIECCNYNEKALALTRHMHKTWLDLGFYCCLKDDPAFRVSYSTFTTDNDKLFYNIALENTKNERKIFINDTKLLTDITDIELTNLVTLSCEENIGFLYLDYLFWESLYQKEQEDCTIIPISTHKIQIKKGKTDTICEEQIVDPKDKTYLSDAFYILQKDGLVLGKVR